MILNECSLEQFKWGENYILENLDSFLLFPSFQLAGASQLRFGTMGKKKKFWQQQNSNLLEVLLVENIASFIIAVVVASLGATPV